MSLIELINDYFGTEHETVHEFNMDFLKGETAKIYANDTSKIIALLSFLSEVDDELERS